MSSHPKNKSTPLLSIVIPTRERALYLEKCVETALICDDDEIEIVVSDNASIDNTRAVIESFDDPRLRYVNTGRRVPMTENFEFALAATTGENILFIGDDDAVLPNGVCDLLVLLRTKQPDAVRWWTGDYMWPSDPPDSDDGLLSFKPKFFVGGTRELDPEKVWELFCTRRMKNYRSGINIYHGCVSRRVIDRVTDHIGRYFFATSPDVGASILNPHFCDNLIEMGRPVSISGTSTASTGWSTTTFVSFSEQKKSPHTLFANEYKEAGLNKSLARDVRSVRAITFITLLEVCDLLELDTACVDINAWLSWIEADLINIPEPHYQQQADLIDKALTNWGFQELKRRKEMQQNEQPSPRKEKSRRKRLTVSPNRIRIGTRENFCEDIASATVVADKIIGNTPLDRRRLWPAIVLAWGMAVGRAIRIVRTT
ncbi:MAG: glycosyltransferase [bacterium]|nr:glycosyltransferase [bacterium]